MGAHASSLRSAPTGRVRPPARSPWRRRRASFSRLQQDGELRRDLDPQRVGQLVTAMMDGLQLQWLLDPDAVDMVGLFEDFLHLLEIPPRGGAGAASTEG
ncbi:TetR family transcriptional regulator C-terminal domain-containing protein [Microbacterium telephonicum]|uniref:TetR family transcriptional regulator C-terminal domain-containing protein n=1 Tax=Microbacterium telephonicum TaxID=1714841 RepID=UPI001F5431AD|nr:TetR family transcriptional regulator C-terminal domain-containing protein [Microbacterium telephonicum]